MISNELQNAIEAQWLSRAKAQDLKPTSVKYLRAECEFFSGVMACLHAQFPNEGERAQLISDTIPARWAFNVMTGRPIVTILPPNHQA